jgi:hypothetical protein
MAVCYAVGFRVSVLLLRLRFFHVSKNHFFMYEKAIKTFLKIERRKERLIES